MGLITKEVEVKLSNNIKYYEEKGYRILREKNKKGKMTVPRGTKIKVKVEDLPNNSNLRVDIQCNKCRKILKSIRWQDYKEHVHENGKYYCKKCGINLFGKEKSNKTKLKNGKSFGYWLIRNLSLRQAVNIISRWDEELNQCDIREIGFSSKGFNNKGYYFKCLKHLEHGSELKNIIHFVNRCNSMECNMCNSFAQWGIDNIGEDFLEKYWDYEKNIDKNGNPINPWEISKSYNKKIFIFCQEHQYHGSYDISCDNFANNNARCSYCVGRKTHPKDSLGQYIIDNHGQEFLDKIWSEKNIKSPYKYAPMSNKFVYWKCLYGKHKDYPRSITNANKSDFRCPECTRERKESILQEKTRLSLNMLGYNVLHENKCTLIPKNPKTRMNLPFDNEIILSNGKHLICEVMGEQHYEEMSKNNPWLNGKTPEEYLHYQQLKDRYKRFRAYKNGYEYLELPYWVFDKQDTYKKLIDDKIQEILNKESNNINNTKQYHFEKEGVAV